MTQWKSRQRRVTEVQRMPMGLGGHTGNQCFPLVSNLVLRATAVHGTIPSEDKQLLCQALEPFKFFEFTHINRAENVRRQGSADSSEDTKKPKKKGSGSEVAREGPCDL
ncbi:hypothetical protein FB451DRAFT_1180441 [Mycena latifolia]|nr:hypothetical protein FB451DRAFT_1180441 [Mycena latifolia]